jgi:putative heme-binding domain-containing protein
MGFRNEYDIAFDPNGELFTYDADMEWDVNLPWYRPTRVCHVVSGAEFGWRHGSGKWPEHFADSVSPVINIGPGSPTGIVFGTGAKFPASYQNALFIADWSYGMIYAVRMEPNGATFTATKEKFCSAPALPVTDLVVNKTDGAMYFLIGGRRSQSALYRVSYTGGESTDPATYPAADPTIAIRKKLESFHLPGVKIDWSMVADNLGHEDRSIRYAARTAVEHQPVDEVTKIAFQSELNTQQTLEMMMAVARVGGESNQVDIVNRLDNLQWSKLSTEQQLHLIRDYGLILTRLGTPTEKTLESIKKLSPHFPTGNETIDLELGKLLVASGSEVTGRIVKLLLTPSPQESQIAYAMMLSDAKAGWTGELREQYFQWFLDAVKSKGGNSFGGYIQNIRKHAVNGLSIDEKKVLADVLSKQPETNDPYADLKARDVVKKWTMDDLMPIDESAFENRNLENGKNLFALASCYRCHRLEGQGGIVGPDLTPAGHRFSTKDLLETIIDPSKEISDQYEATIFQMIDGEMIVGRVANLNGENYMIQKDMIDPGNFTNIKVKDIEEMKPSKISMMPPGLLDTLTKEDILDLLGYLKSVGKEAATKE